MAFPWMVNFFNPPRDLFRLQFGTQAGSQVSFNWWNNTSIDLEIAEIEIDWPAGNEGLFNMFNGGVGIWNGFDPSPPTIVNSGWSGTPANRTWDAKSNDDMEFFFGSAASSGYTLRVLFTNGWEIEASG